MLFVHSFSQSSDEESSEQSLEEIQMLLEEASTEKAEEQEVSSELEEEPIIIVDVKGQVKQPGVYELESDARVLDAVDIAGGLSDEADSQKVNLAQKVTDQMMIYIPAVGEELPEEIEQSEEAKEGGSININTADAMELTRLKGIGEVRAQSIIEYRESNGLFQTIEEIKQVSGIGEGIFEGIKDEIIVKD